MSNNRKEQIEALETLVDFNSRLVKNMSIIVKELSGERLNDAVCEKNDSKIADAFTKIIVVFENLGNVAKDVIAQ